MRERITARVLLLDGEDRILLMRGRLPSNPSGAGAWFTVGGAAEPGESVQEAALREIREEAGIIEVVLGPVVWSRRAVHLMGDNEPVLFIESYVVARCEGVEPSRDGWQEVERTLCDDIRWWTLADLSTAQEDVYPQGLARRLPDILAGRYPAKPVDIT